MRKEYGKALREQFDKAMQESFSEFTNVKDGGDYLQPGERVYGKAFKDTIHCFIILVPDRSGADQFSIEIGWSKLGRFPHLRLRPNPGGWGTEKSYSQDEYVCRLTGISKQKDIWWTVGQQMSLIKSATTPGQLVDEITRNITPEEAKAAVKTPVDESIKELETFGLPYLKGFLQSCGIDEE